MVYNLVEYLWETRTRFPEKTAIICKDEQITFSGLDDESNKLANFLVEIGAYKGERIAVLRSKDIKALMVLWAILKVGGVYVPIDPNLPPSRIKYMLDECDIKIVIASDEALMKCGHQVFTGLEYQIIADDFGNISGNKLYKWSLIENQPVKPPEVRTISTDLAYILYTSGSTGNPKGVMITHGNVVPYIHFCRDFFKLSEKDRYLNTIPLHLDRSVLEVFCHVAAGATDVILGRHLFVKDIFELIDRHKVTFISTAPITLGMFVDRTSGISNYSLASLKTILFGGEACPVKYIRKLKELIPWVGFINGYGPTETVVHATYYSVTDLDSVETEYFPIGKSLPTTEVLVVDENGCPVPRGEIGELVIRGSNVMRGYWKNEEKTREVLKDVAVLRDFGEKAYYTGDLARVNDKGDLYFLGRKDNQIKSRGYRIELEEIEAVFARNPHVKEAGAIAIPDSQIGNKIAAYVVCENIEEAELKKFIEKALPKYMIPHYWIFCSRLPRSPFGKIDRKSLLEDFNTNYKKDGKKIVQ